MYRDDAVEEIRQRRKELLQKQFGGSMKRFGEAAREWQRKHPDQVVNLHDLKRKDRCMTG